MTRTIGAGLTTDIAAQSAERCQLIKLEFADLSNNATPVYFTTAAVDILWNSITWQAVGGTMDIDAMGESAEDPSNGLRIKLSGVNQTVLALILGARWRGRLATIYHAGFDRTTGLVLTDPVVMFSGPMNGGFEIGESRGDFGGGTVDISARFTSRLDELVKVRGVRTNVVSHQMTIPGAATDTFFQHVDNLVLRKTYWGMKTPTQPPPVGGPSTDGNPYGGVPNGPAGTPWTPPANTGNPSVPNAPAGTPAPPPTPGKTGIWNI